MTPAVTVLMAVRNGEMFLAETLASIAAQTLDNYEFVIVDDASDDGTGHLLADAAARDSRISVLTNRENLGLTRSLNVGLGAARAPYVARIDADDTSSRDRLAVQAAFLDSHPDHCAVACGHEVIDGHGRRLRVVKGGLDDWQVRWLAGFNPPAPHPCYFFRREKADGTPWAYDEGFRTAQDFDFWSRLMAEGRTGVLPQVLVRYRRHSGAITVTRRFEQAQNCAAIGRRNLAVRVPAEVAQALEPLIDLFAYRHPATGSAIAAAVAGADALLQHDMATSEGRRHAWWMRRRLAGLLADAVLSRAGGLTQPQAVARFAWHARKHLLALLSAVAEDPGMALKSIGNRRTS